MKSGNMFGRRGWRVITAMALSVSVLLAACSPGDTGADQPETGTGEEVVINFHSWSDTARNRFESVVTLPEGVSVNWVITPTEGNAYQLNINNLLLNSPGSIDLFTAEVDFILNYVQPGATLDVIGDIGLTEDDLRYMYPFTLQAATGPDGILRGVSWQANPGLFLYRRSIAQQVFGTDDPDYIQSRVNTWQGFYEVAQLMHDSGFQMLSGFDDSFRVFANNRAQPWVNENNEIVIDPLIHEWIDQTVYFTQNGFNNRSVMWDSVWASDQGVGSTVFGFFYSTWGVALTLVNNALETPVAEGGVLEVGNGLFGDWAAVHGPASWNWGGSWIMAPESSTLDRELIRSIMYQMTVNQDNLRVLVEEWSDFANNSALMEEIAAEPDFGNDFLGGQNHIALFAETARNISMDNISPYDQAMTSQLLGAMSDYFNGVVTREQAWDNFFTSVTTFHPHLQRPAS